MPLTNALNMTVLGMMTTDTKVSVSAQNITNADKVGYAQNFGYALYHNQCGGRADFGHDYWLN